jgi:mycofactocin system glycosyltransferase
MPPSGIGLRADPGLRRTGGGRVLIGGSPLRIIRVSDKGSAVVDNWIDGAPLADVKAARALAGRLLDAGMIHPVVKACPTPPPVTVIVPVKDDADELDRLLATVDQATVVVDDASEDEAAVAAVVARHGAVLVRRDTSGGPGVARMAGLVHVDTEFVVFVDSDVTLSSGWWPALAAYFDDDEVVAVAPRVASRPGPTLRERYEAVHSPLDLGPNAANVGPRRAVAYVPTAAFAVRRSAIDTVGGFDPELRVGEDVDLVWRLAAEVGTIRYAPEVVVHHRPRPSWRAWFAQRRLYGRSAVDLAARHGAVVAPARCSRWSFAAWVCVMCRRPFVGVGLAVGSSLALIPKLENVPDPAMEAVRIAGWGQLHAGRGLALAVSRVWWPIVIPAALFSRRLRPGVAAAMLAPAAWDWFRGARPTGPVRSVGLRVADDMAYGVGVWQQVVRRRDGRALAPELTEWPGRRAAVDPDTVAR